MVRCGERMLDVGSLCDGFHQGIAE
ncbi:unnamed protein product, partial [Rotaria magnacalcarata]